MLTDMTFSNSLIKSYFNGDDSHIPTSELIYLHEHPLIRNSFLVELELLINKTSEYLVRNNVQGDIVKKFIDSAVRIGTLLPSVNSDNASEILSQLRIVYNLCNSLLKQSYS